MKKIIAAMVAISGLAGCTASGMGQADDVQIQLGDYRWTLDSATVDDKRIDGFFARPDKPLTLSFRDNRIGVENACNFITGIYHIEQDMLTVEPLESTMMACVEPAISHLDMLVGEYIQGAHNMTLQDGTRPQLTLKNDKAMLVLHGQATPESLYGKGETVFFAVAPQTVPCTSGTMQHNCLQVREVHYNEQGVKVREDADWTVLHTPIEGYEHHDGVADVIRVQRYQRNNPPADAGSVVYVYDTTVESTLP